MNERTMKILEYHKVVQKIQAKASTSLGKQAISQMAPYLSLAEAERELEAVDEAVRIIQRRGPLPFGGITDVKARLNKAEIGGVLAADELNQVVYFIQGGRQLRQALQAALELMELPLHGALAELIYDARQTELEIRQAISDEGTLYDHASPELRRIRTAERQIEQRIRQQLDHMLRAHQKYLQDPIIAMRGDNFCLPVKVEFKSQIPGIVHDYSASGATVFVEPHSVVESSAKIRALKLEEEREIERILMRLSATVAEISSELALNLQYLSQIDAWMAKAEYGLSERYERPTINGAPNWALRQARHPLISRTEAVPVDLTLGSDFQMLIITGPNTGGKTVTLKTIGLLTLLAMSGCFLPAAAGSQVGWCDNIFADIGDEQSIEQSLSTFSSHMRSIVEMLSGVTQNSLVLLDELGAGTDPAEGAALSISILEYLRDWGTRVVATTHYAELKAFAFQEPLATNASMEFDVQTLRPTYRLLVGVPGRSNALAIASRLGLSNTLVERAKGHLHADDIRVEDLIGKMEHARREAELLHQEAQKEQEQAARLRAELETQRTRLREETERIQQKALQEAKITIEKAQAEAEKIIQELRHKQANGMFKDHELVELRKGLEAALPSVSARPGKSAVSRPLGRIQIGATVRVSSLDQKGEVVEQIDGETFMVQLGQLRMKVKGSDLELLENRKLSHKTTNSVKRGLNKSISLQIDVRGETVDDASVRVDRYLDEAVLNGLARVTIIHGKGTGALRDGVRRFIAKHRQVKSWAQGGPGEGGDGATVVTLKV